jgi:hypothetical protein
MRVMNGLFGLYTKRGVDFPVLGTFRTLSNLTLQQRSAAVTFDIIFPATGRCFSGELTCCTELASMLLFLLLVQPDHIGSL